MKTFPMQKDQQIDSNKFATIAVNLLHRGIIESGRTTAKRIFRALEEEQRVKLTTLKMEDGGTIQMDLIMDARAFNGNLNYSAWRDGVLALIAKMSDELRAGQQVPVFYPMDPPESLPDEMTNTKLFGAVGATVHDGVMNALMLGVQPDPNRPVVTLQLTYVDPGQFVAPAAEGSAAG
ncbi:MAG: hypothetical protein RLZZ602_2044 [Pseudomonadota bacterium]